MSELRLEHWTIPTAPLGAENPLPSFERPHYQPLLTGDPEQDRAAGYVPDYLPYTMQDGYTRQRQPTPQPVAVLENEICAPRSCSSAARGCGHWCTSQLDGNFCTSIPCSSPLIWRCAMRGSAGALNGTWG
ncbi:MAG: hypothetical protein IPK17_00065 [Chloroflexi bacterium]|uniref:hypothetical protein n=1 Tax=Candidatus Flexifilum breve TaxID=3140694 RepID=UPI0031374048|nr:hypothetical protein [Chloroflexota bacterium]